jgi:hypothetical protein
MVAPQAQGVLDWARPRSLQMMRSQPIYLEWVDARLQGATARHDGHACAVPSSLSPDWGAEPPGDRRRRSHNTHGGIRGAAWQRGDKHSPRTTGAVLTAGVAGMGFREGELVFHLRAWGAEGGPQSPGLLSPSPPQSPSSLAASTPAAAWGPPRHHTAPRRHLTARARLWATHTFEGLHPTDRSRLTSVAALLCWGCPLPGARSPDG